MPTWRLECDLEVKPSENATVLFSYIIEAILDVIDPDCNGDECCQRYWSMGAWRLEEDNPEGEQDDSA